ncbi:MAG TPA: amino acid--tRNA ligase-related protein [Candidatus Paceibacterota bacterium]
MKNRVYIKDLGAHLSKTVTVMGWVNICRNQGKMVFIDLRDETGVVQCVVLPKSAPMENGIASGIKQEFVLALEGEVLARPERSINKNIENGDIELRIENIEVLNTAATPPFELTGDTSNIDENVRLEYRYLDLRTARLQKNIRERSAFVQKCREFLFKNRFIEIETPLLTESTPEGSRDFVVPSRRHPGDFYALPQSPQQYKQLLMVGGFERYFQVARCVRDEDLRADRGFEHTQIDIEMSFVEQEDVMSLVEQMMIETVESLGFTIKEKPFPRFTYAEALEKFGADKFDLREGEEKQNGVLAYAWVYKFPFFEKTDAGGWTFTHNPFSMPIPEHKEWLLKGENIGNILTTQYDLVCNGFETAGGSIRAHKPELLEATYKIMGYNKEQIEDSVGHMLRAFTFGAPPHGGIAFGVERNLMNLTGEKYLREVQAFPMTRGGRTAVMNAPKPLTSEQMKELGIQALKKPAH